MSPDGSETVLHRFPYNGYPDGENPSGQLVLGADGALYGETESDGVFRSTSGISFKIATTNSPQFSSPTTAVFNLGYPSDFTITASGSPTPTFSVEGLPSWSTFDPTSGVISGTPTSASPNSFQIKIATNGVSPEIYQTLTLTVAEIAPYIFDGPPPDATVGEPYRFSYFSLGSPCIYSAESGSLPPGLSLSSDGIISGIPTKTGLYQGTITATNGGGSNNQTFWIRVDPPLQTIHFSPITDKVYVSAPFTLSATASSGLPVSFWVADGNATVWGNQLTLTGTGPVIIRAYQVGNENYSPATVVWQRFMVTSASGTAPVNFTQWAAKYPSIGGPNDTPLKDGIPNLLKFFCGIDPISPLTATDQAALPSVEMATGADGTTYLTLKYRQSGLATELQADVQTSTDLQNWVTVIPDISQQIGVDETGSPIIENKVACNGIPRLFIRLQLTDTTPK